MQQASLPPQGLSRRRMVMALPLLGGAVWGGGASAGARVVSERSSRPLMGTQVDMAVEGVDGPQLRRAMDRAYAEMLRLEALMSRYQPRSVVSRINLAAGVTPVMVPAEVMAEVRRRWESPMMEALTWKGKIESYAKIKAVKKAAVAEVNSTVPGPV